MTNNILKRISVWLMSTLSAHELTSMYSGSETYLIWYTAQRYYDAWKYNALKLCY